MLNIKDLLKFAGESSPLVYNFRQYSQSNFLRKMVRKFSTPYGIYKYFFPRKLDGRKGLALVLIAKNEAQCIEEWIDFHVKQGVSHFFIYDNESTDNFHEVLKPYISSGLVSYHITKGRGRQTDVYNMAIAEYGSKFKYMGFIDCDEFVFVRKPYREGNYNLCDFLDDFMSEHKNAGGIVINWLIFGSNGHDTKPEGGILENYTRCAEKDFIPNIHIKTICDPLKVVCFRSAHFPIYSKGFYNIDEAGNIVEGALTEAVHFDRVRINHYFTKSKEEYVDKMNRGRADIDDKDTKRTMDDFYGHDRNECSDTEILLRI